MLRLSPSVVSYRIQMLEDALGARLLTRTTRTMRLTEAGELFLEHCREIIEAVERAEASVAESSGVSARGVLSVTAPLGLGRRVVAPMMARYRQAQPHTDVRLRLSDHLLDLVREGVDLAIRLARMEDSSFTLRKVAEVRARALRRARLSGATRRARERRGIWRATTACCCAFPARSNFAGASTFAAKPPPRWSRARSTPTTATC